MWCLFPLIEEGVTCGLASGVRFNFAPQTIALFSIGLLRPQILCFLHFPATITSPFHSPNSPFAPAHFE